MNETLHRWTFNFHKVVRQQNAGAVEDFNLPYSAVYLRFQKWKNYWNRSTFAKVIVKNKSGTFFMAHGVISRPNSWPYACWPQHGRSDATGTPPKLGWNRGSGAHDSWQISETVPGAANAVHVSPVDTDYPDDADEGTDAIHSVSNEYARLAARGYNGSNEKQSHDVYTALQLGNYKKALLSQRRPRDAPNIWVPWKVSRVLANAPGYFSRNL